LGKKGYLLQSTAYTESKDNWMSTVGTIAGIITVLAFILFFLATGWLVITGLYIIPAVIVGVIVIIIFKIIFKILGSIFNQIRIRF
jgi:cobalamin biosynthesis protein CobD/CbiB